MYRPNPMTSRHRVRATGRDAVTWRCRTMTTSTTSTTDTASLDSLDFENENDYPFACGRDAPPGRHG